MNHRVYKPIIDLKSLEEDIRINSDIVMMEGTKRNLLVNSKHTTLFNSILIDSLEDFTGEVFNPHVKNIFTIAEESTEQVINFSKQILDDIDTVSDYSFIYLIESCVSEITFQDKKIFINVGELAVFNTDYFVSQQAQFYSRVGLYGSITNKVNQNTPTLSLI